MNTLDRKKMVEKIREENHATADLSQSTFFDEQAYINVNTGMDEGYWTRKFNHRERAKELLENMEQKKEKEIKDEKIKKMVMKCLKDVLKELIFEIIEEENK